MSKIIFISLLCAMHKIKETSEYCLLGLGSKTIDHLLTKLIV